MRRALIALLFAHLSLTPIVRAQSCHAAPETEGNVVGLRTSVSGELATFKTRRFEGDYRGMTVGALFIHPRVSFGASIPYFRIVRNGLAAHGWGDAVAQASVTPFRSSDGEWSLGVLGAAMLPTGDADHDLGMGHVMLMPALFGAWHRAHWGAELMVGYGRALAKPGDSGAHHHHGGVGPIVRPMNMSEVSADGNVIFRAHPHLHFRVGASAAVPVDSPEGASRATALAGVTFIVGPFDLGVFGQLPLVGDPIVARAVVSAGWRF